MYLKKILLTIVFLGLLVAAYFAYFVYATMFTSNTAFESDSISIYISSEDRYRDVRSKLEPVLKDINKFDLLAKRKKYINNIKSGRYVIKKSMTNNAIINTLRSKNTPVNVSFNNQETLEKLAGRVSKQIQADSSSLLRAMRDKTFLSKHKFNRATALAMYLPNSYEFYWNTSATVFRKRMLREYQHFWNKNRRAKAQAIGLSPMQVMTLASIVYEESKQPAEQPRIAGVYMNRLRINMPLQADPTLKYAAYQLPKYKHTVIKRVLNVHKTIVSPYNTYMHQGLPPGPIAMPDISAIDAVLHYEKHQYLYFSADPKRLGFHKFAKTLTAHNRNAKAYQQYLSRQGIRR